MNLSDLPGNLRVPPHSVEAEQAVLAALLLQNDSLERCSDLLSERDFYRHEHRLLFSTISRLINDRKSADVISVFETLQNKAEQVDLQYINALTQSLPSAANIRRHAEIVRGKSLLREIIVAADEAVTAAFNPQGASAVDIAEAVSAKFADMQRKSLRKVPRSIYEIALQRTQEYDDLSNGKRTPGWRTHIPWLTTAMNGGFRPGGLYILAARPSVGKSSFAQELGMQLASDDLPTLFLSQEMGDTEIADRGVVNMGRLSYSSLASGKMTQDHWERASEALERMGKLPFFIDDQPAQTIQDIRLKAKQVPSLKVLMVDYLQLCSGSSKGGNRNSEIEEISRGLKALAKDMGIAVVALSQLNREVEKRPNKRPNLSDLRDSGAIEQDADMVMFLWTVNELPNEGRRIVGLSIEKNRQGRTGLIGLDFYGDIQRWTQSDVDISHQPSFKASKDFE